MRNDAAVTLCGDCSNLVITSITVIILVVVSIPESCGLVVRIAVVAVSGDSGSPLITILTVIILVVVCIPESWELGVCVALHVLRTKEVRGMDEGSS